MVNLEFREGKTHCQNGTPDFVRETIRVSHEITDHPLLSIFDSGNDDIKTIRACKAEGSDFIYLACRFLANKANRSWLYFGRHCPIMKCFGGYIIAGRLELPV